MKFKCYYREADGSKQTREIEAVSRAEAFETASKMNLKVIEMFEDKPASTKPRARKPRPEKSEEQKEFVRKEHSYILGFLLGPVGFVTASALWRKTGVRYGAFGFGMFFVSVLLANFLGILGLSAGLVLAVVLENRLCGIDGKI